MKTAIVFSNRKTTVRDLATSLRRDGFAAGPIHGDMEQPERIRELERFKSGEINILVASDVAARGLDIKGVSHVFNYDVPWQPDDYIHRIGRTGRAGATGIAITLATREDADQLAAIERLIGRPIPPNEDEAGPPQEPALRDGPPGKRERKPREKKAERPEPKSRRKAEDSKDGGSQAPARAARAGSRTGRGRLERPGAELSRPEPQLEALESRASPPPPPYSFLNAAANAASPPLSIDRRKFAISC